jgi:arginine decarboxylase
MTKPADKAGANGAKGQSATRIELNQFFSAAEARVDRWRSLHRLTKALAASDASASERVRNDVKALVDELRPLEELNGYPGPQLMAQLDQQLEAADAQALARTVQRISASLLSNSYRDDAHAWSDDEDNESRMADAILPPTLGRGQSRRPYFEVLIVAAGERATWPELRETFRKLRRDDDSFV